MALSMKPIWIATLFFLAIGIWAAPSAQADVKKFPGGVTAFVPPGYIKIKAPVYVKEGDEAYGMITIMNGMRDRMRLHGKGPYPTKSEFRKAFGPVLKKHRLGPMGEIFMSHLMVDGRKLLYAEIEREEVRAGQRYYQLKMAAGPSNHGYLLIMFLTMSNTPTKSAIKEAQKMMDQLVIKTIPSIKLHGN